MAVAAVMERPAWWRRISMGLIVGNRRDAAELGVEPGRYVELRVSDTGCEMDQDVVSRIFDPFFTTRPIG